MRVAFVVALALIACTFVAAQSAEVAPRFAEAEVEDQAVLAEQQKTFEASLESSQIEDEAEAEDEAADESEEEAEGEAEEESEEDEEADEEDEEEADEEAEDEEEADEEADEESEEEEEESDESEADNTEFVLAELSDNAISTGFMEMTATFKPVEPVEAHHMVHSLASHQLAVAQQEYAVGYAHGQSDAAIAAASNADESEDEAEASFVEANSEAETDAEHAPVQYIASNGQPYFASYPAHVATVQPYYGGVPMPPQLPTWLPPPPYITPVAPAGGKSE
jgi:hypothetical protein